MKRIQRIILFLTIAMLLPALLSSSCESNRGQIIPYVKVDEYLLLYADLASLGVGSTMTIKGGYQGIVLYRESDLQFYAYDRTCTQFPLHDEAVVEDEEFMGVFECPECSSTYLLMNGAEPNSGPARFPLVQYKASIQGDVLHVYN